MTVKFLSSYSTRPLQMFGALGLSMGCVGLADLRVARRTSASSGSEIGDRPLLLLGVFMVLAACSW